MGLYGSYLAKILKLDRDVYHQVATKEKSFRLAVLNIVILGALYGYFASRFNAAYLAETIGAGSYLALSLVVIAGGVVLIFLIHAGLSLVVLTFARGVGSSAGLGEVYYNLGLVAAVFWFSAPALAALEAGVVSWPIGIWAAITCLWGILAAGRALESALRLSPARLIAAFGGAVVFTLSFIYLWL